MRLGCLARILLTLDVLIEAATAVNDEIATHIHCLQEHELTPEDRNHIEQNLADGVERALQVIGMHQLHQSLKLDELSVGCVDDQKMTPSEYCELIRAINCLKLGLDLFDIDQQLIEFK